MNVWFARKLTAALGFFGVLLGAFGAHALHARLEAAGTMAAWQTGVLYHLIHAVALLAITSRNAVSRLTFWCFFVGVVVFSGSLYLLALTNIRWFGAITPLGGLGMLLGWLSLVFSKPDKVP
jgi:uncharacterized membrane protein YgdD (TMEM256/DUF423 family)